MLTCVGHGCLFDFILYAGGLPRFKILYRPVYYIMIINNNVGTPLRSRCR